MLLDIILYIMFILYAFRYNVPLYGNVDTTVKSTSVDPPNVHALSGGRSWGGGEKSEGARAGKKEEVVILQGGQERTIESISRKLHNPISPSFKMMFRL